MTVNGAVIRLQRRSTGRWRAILAGLILFEARCRNLHANEKVALSECLSAVLDRVLCNVQSELLRFAILVLGHSTQSHALPFLIDQVWERHGCSSCDPSV